jgi:spoIIIJ-associated protein
MTVAREFEGQSLDAALEAASKELGIPVDDLHYEMVEHGRKGVFGLGARQVRVRIELDGTELLAPTAPVREKKRSDPPRPRTARDDRGGRGQRGNRANRGGRRDRSGRSPRSERAQRAEQSDTQPGEAAAPHVKDFQETLERMLDLMGLQMEVRVTGAGSNNLRAVLSGRDRRTLLQKEGQLISSINFVLNRMARRAWPGVGRIQVQCDGQRDRRDDELVELVREVAGQVARSGQPKELHPMNPYERRIAHITVRDFPELDSHSEGDAFLKTITVTKRDA